MLAGQHQCRIGLNCKFTRLRIIAVANRHHAGILQIAQKTVVGIVHRLGRYAVTLLTRTDQEIGDVGRQPILFRAIFIPEGKTTVITLHLQQTGDADINSRTAFVIRIAFDAEGSQLRRVGIERREQAACGLFQATVWIGLQFADITRQVQRWFTAEQQLTLQGSR
ncbi:hypothetical protein D3C81_1489560 [compost metagenome]